MAIDAGTVARVRSLWLELMPIWEEDLDRCHRMLESESDAVKIAGLQARAKAVRSYMNLPETLAKELEFDRQSKKENTRHATV